MAQINGMDNLFSLRRKILILLMSISFVSGLAFLMVSITTFKNDKIAYIFETNNSLINNLSNQFKNEFKAATLSAKSILVTMTPEGVFSMGSIAEDHAVDAIEVYKISAMDKSLNRVSTISKPGVSHLDAETISARNLIAQKNKVLSILSDDVLIVEKLQQGTDTMAVFYYFKSDALRTFFEKDKSYVSFVVDSTGRIVKSDSSLDVRYVNQNFLPSFQEIKSLGSSTLKIKTKDKKNWLMTSVAMGYEDYYLISMVDEDQALGALKSLTTKSILIFAIIFFIIIIIGVFTSTVLTSRLSMLTAATRKVIAGDFNVVVAPKGKDEITELTSSFNKMTQEIVRLMGETANKARMESELKTAQAVQETLFPEPEVKYKEMHIKGQYISASECGGDWWYYSEDEQKISIWIADATGHGASAALLTSAARSAVSLIETMKVQPVEAMSLLNKAICSVSKENMMMTCFLAVFDKKTKILQYVNASHEAPIIFKPLEQIKKKDLIFLNEVVGSRLGQHVDSEYLGAETQLESGDRMLFYTDGVPDIQNPQQESLGERGFIKILTTAHNQKLNFVDFAEDVNTSLAQFREKSELIDDVTYCFTEIT
ncbi:MAG: hypothetical protein A2622_13325 [Bdellovibrionales bacterium RIFCSPHIGHO2_01_FULL_40_29]|nr:MAG: hypothetical protein A2622_13325 [Bdellovibrionales bacterium RIFCSPHIGHO2_01_FULL_40_29]OFZ33331.1 MAG: hypothetical protein A3D17_13560 [Bdellovibrionales bacterium RIFCSPHIGHO2_02_FULL_40_15]